MNGAIFCRYKTLYRVLTLSVCVKPDTNTDRKLHNSSLPRTIWGGILPQATIDIPGFNSQPGSSS